MTLETMYGSSFSLAEKTRVTSAAGGNRAKFLRASPLFLLVGLLLVLTFLLGSLAAVRLIRRYRLRVEATRRGPSAYEDVWSMHKIPPRDEELDD